MATKKADPQKALPRGKPQPDTGQPGGGAGRVDLTGVDKGDVRVDPNATEGHPGYQESGSSELTPPEHGAPIVWIRKTLQARGVRFEERHHPEAYTAQEVAQYEHVSGHHVAKVVVVIADGRPVEVFLPASRKVRMDQVQKVLNAKDVRLASEEEIEKIFTDCEVGALPALRHWKDVQVLMDRSLQVDGDILFQAGTHTDAIQMNYQEWYELVQPQVATLSYPA